MSDVTAFFGKKANRVIETLETDGVDQYRGKGYRELRDLCIKRGAPASEVESGEGGLERPWTVDDCKTFLGFSAFMPQSRRLADLNKPIGLNDLTRPALLRMAKETGAISGLKTTLSDSALRDRIRAKMNAIHASAEGTDGDNAAPSGEHAPDAGAGDLVGPDGAHE